MQFKLILVTAFGLFASSTYAACKCARVSNPGIYCGYCAEVTSCGDRACVKHAYECSRNGDCHEYGYSWRCDGTKTDARYCDGRDRW